MVKVGIIGSGFGLYGLLPAFNLTSGCKVVAICGKKTERLVNYCQSIGLENIYTDWQEMLKKEKLDAIAIAVIPSAQHQIAKVAIKKGLHIFAEKPLALTLLQAEELLRLAEKKKIKHVVDFMFPEIEEWKKVKSLIDKKILGNLRQVNLNWDFLSYDIKNKISSWKTDSTQGGGALSFYFSHCLYYLEHFAGQIINLKSQFIFSKESSNGGEVGVNLLLEFKNKVSGYAHISCSTKGLNRHQLVFICDKGTIILENEGSFTENFNIRIYTSDGVKQLTLPKEREAEKNIDERVKIVKKLASRFINSILQKKEIIPSFTEGVRVQELIDKIRKQDILN